MTYFALSYVWGESQQLTLTKQNLEELEREGSLFAREADLSRTIAEAIQLCRQVGHQYLWVDALCIVQDGGQEKHGQIAMMDAIYSRALATIVAAAGTDADAGLPPLARDRLGSGRPFHIETIGGDQFVAAPSPQATGLRVGDSTWASRGWTLQEEALSSRNVYFTGDHVIFRCGGGVWSEDMGLDLAPYARKRLRQWADGLIRFPRRQTRYTAYLMHLYSRLLSQYLVRNLTVEEDIVDAFQGILTRMSRMGQPQLWGLPIKTLGASLMWMSRSICASRRMPAFPSWSWAGW
jgi:hypothetical protein